jgi:MinD-like ATPase involved in chromosome partitioning or flagellar assembly
VRNKRFELSTREIEESTGVPVLAVLPDDVKVVEALAKSTPASVFTPKRDFAVEYKKLAASLVGEEYRETGMLRRVREFLVPDNSLQSANRASFIRGLNE